LDEFSDLIRALLKHNVRSVVIGVWGANYYAARGSMVFETNDRDLFLPPNAQNMLAAWQACRESSFSLWVGDEPLGEPLDQQLAGKVIEQRALVTAISASGSEQVDLSLVMKGFSFEEVWLQRRIFRVGEVEIPVASLTQIVESKRQANRAKDRLFLATHAEALEQLLRSKK
jgi:hypothetical protein